MPLEIREIAIKLFVGESEHTPDVGEAAEAGTGLSESERARIVADCVAAVLAELDRRREP